MDTFMAVGRVALEAVAVFLAASFVFDCIHFLLHWLQKSRWRLVRWVGDLHRTHHEFYGTDLKHSQKLVRDNLLRHVVPEYLTQMAVCALSLVLVSPWAAGLVAGFFTVVFITVLVVAGKDPHHRELDTVAAPLNNVTVGPVYHALHHVYPEGYFGSYHTLFDRVFGTACPLNGKTVALTGAGGSFGGPLKAKLERRGATVLPLAFGTHYTHDDYSGMDDALTRADILVLAHGVKGEGAMAVNCGSFVAMVERFRSLAVGRQVAPEVWAVGSECELHPSFGNAELANYAASKRAFARHARGYYADRGLLYRHVVPAAFASRMGWGPMSGGFAAGLALFLIRRGFRYVPVTWTGLACLNYVKFLFTRPAGERKDLTPGPELANSAT
jgi:monoglucosyldiacylglycerol epimerase